MTASYHEELMKKVVTWSLAAFLVTVLLLLVFLVFVGM